MKHCIQFALCFFVREILLLFDLSARSCARFGVFFSFFSGGRGLVANLGILPVLMLCTLIIYFRF